MDGGGCGDGSGTLLSLTSPCSFGQRVCLLPWHVVAPVVLLAVWLYQLGFSRLRAVSYARRHSCNGYWYASALGRGPPGKGMHRQPAALLMQWWQVAASLKQ